MTWIAGALLSGLLALGGWYLTGLSSSLVRLEAAASVRAERLAAVETAQQAAEHQAVLLEARLVRIEGKIDDLLRRVR